MNAAGVGNSSMRNDAGINTGIRATTGEHGYDVLASDNFLRKISCADFCFGLFYCQQRFDNLREHKS
jgi:hypothetical protein